MKLTQSAIIVSVLVLAAIITLFFLVFGASGRFDGFAKCLNASGARMYGAWWCPHCNDEKTMFGDSWKYVNYTECSNPDYSQKEICKEANITGYPTWEFRNGSRIVGPLTFDQLSQETGCSVTAK